MRTRLLAAGMLAASLGVWHPLPASAQGAPAQSIVTVEQPDAERTKRELGQLLERYPPTLRNVLELDPTLLSNQPYLAPYPALVSFLNAHPEIARSPSFYVGEPPQPPKDRASLALDMWREIYNGASVFAPTFSTTLATPVSTNSSVLSASAWRMATMPLALNCTGPELIVAGGTENMSRAPYLLEKARSGYKMAPLRVD